MRWTDESFKRVVALANEAALQPRQWDALVDAIAGALGANGGALFTPEIDTSGANLVATAGTGTGVLPEYATHWVAEDPWVLALNQSGRVLQTGEVFLADELVTPAELQRTGFYNDFSKAYGVENIIGLKIVGENDRVAPITHLSLFETRNAGVPFGDPERRALYALWPHLQRAVHAYWTLRKARDFDCIAEGALEVLPQPTWVLRADLCIDYANRAARHLMSTMPWLRATARKLIAVGDLDTAALNAAVRAADFGGGRRWAAAIPLNGRLRRVVLHVTALAGVQPYATAWPHARALLTLGLPSADEVTTLWIASLSRRYGFTPSECRVLELLSAGRSTNEVATAMKVAYSTVRTHVAALYAKTGCHRQAELVRLVHGD